MRGQMPESIGRYQVLDLLGRGGMGVVYRGLDPDIGRPVAIKVLAVDQEGLRQRFLQEARSAGKLQHSNIVTIYEYGAHQGDPFIAMEFIDGVTLAQRLATRGPVGTALAIDYIRQISSALDYAHMHGVVHRDVKPANIMIAAEMGVGERLKILDFGIARVSDSTLTHSGVTVGTLNYMSPEQVCGRPVDRRTDVFAVGVVFYELLSGRQAFPGKAPHPVMHAVVNESPEPLSAVVPDLDSALVRIIDRAIAKLPDDRFPTLTEMLLELDRVESERYGVRSIPRGAEGRIGLRQDVLARKRAEAVEQHLQRSARLFEGREYAAALEAAEQAALFDPFDPQVLEWLERAKRAFDEQQTEWLAAARSFLDDHDTEHATELLRRVLDVNPQSVEALQIQETIRLIREQRQSTDLDVQAHTAATSSHAASDVLPEAGARSTGSVLAEPSASNADEPEHEVTEAGDDPIETTGRTWTLVPPVALPDPAVAFKRPTPVAKPGPAVMREVTLRGGDREWLTAGSFSPSRTARGSASVALSFLVHAAAALVAAAVLASPVVLRDPPRQKPPLIVSLPAPPAPPPVARVPPPASRPSPDSPANEMKPTPVESPVLSQSPPPPAPVQPPPIPTTPLIPVATTPPPQPTSPTVDLPPAPPAPPSNIDEKPVTDHDTWPVWIGKVDPKVPVGAEGTVKVRVLILSTGKVRTARVLTPTPYIAEVQRAAEASVFTPARRRGRPVAVEIEITFELKTRK